MSGGSHVHHGQLEASADLKLPTKEGFEISARGGGQSTTRGRGHGYNALNTLGSGEGGCFVTGGSNNLLRSLDVQDGKIRSQLKDRGWHD